MKEYDGLFAGRRIGLITNYSGVDSRLIDDMTVFHQLGYRVVKLFTPEHGMYGAMDGAGVGDMKASVYDTDGDGVVDRAARADAADAVDWTDVQGRPEAFAPAAHRHGMEDVSDPVRQRTRTADPLRKPRRVRSSCCMKTERSRQSPEITEPAARTARMAASAGQREQRTILPEARRRVS